MQSGCRGRLVAVEFMQCECVRRLHSVVADEVTTLLRSHALTQFPNATALSSSCSRQSTHF